MPNVIKFPTLCLLTCLGILATPQPALSQRVPMSDSAATIIEARIMAGADSCPVAVEVWLVSSPDTIQAMELVLLWDRPDFARFTTETVRMPVLDESGATGANRAADSASTANRVIIKPVMARQGGLIEKWEYAEARGETGLSVKVAAFAYLIGRPVADPILPARTGLLFSLPLEILGQPPLATADDSAVVRFDSALTRLSDRKGNLLDNTVLRSASVRTGPCWSPRARH